LSELTKSDLEKLISSLEKYVDNRTRLINYHTAAISSIVQQELDRMITHELNRMITMIVELLDPQGDIMSQ
jgi:hypothetical protein